MVRSIHSQTDYGDARLDHPVTLEQVKNLATRAEAGLSPAEHARLLRGIEDIERRLAETQSDDGPIAEVARLRGLFQEADELADYWVSKPHLGAEAAARHLRPIIAKAMNPKRMLSEH